MGADEIKVLERDRMEYLRFLQQVEGSDNLQQAEKLDTKSRCYLLFLILQLIVQWLIFKEEIATLNLLHRWYHRHRVLSMVLTVHGDQMLVETSRLQRMQGREKEVV